MSIRDVSPAPEAVRLTGTRPDGLPDGVHTGGAWLLNGEVWKPLDGRPFFGCDHHRSTHEVECLEAMAGKPLFPRNWRVEERNGRRFIVRKQALVIPDNWGFDELTRKQLAGIEAAVREMNACGWAINDSLSLAIDPDTEAIFILDLSFASEMRGTGCGWADDRSYVRNFIERCGGAGSWLINLHRNARKVVAGKEWQGERYNRCHVYASFARPVDSMWASIPGDPIFIQTRAAWEESVPYTWVVAREAMPTEIMDRYELEWGWSSPIRHE